MLGRLMLDPQGGEGNGGGAETPTTTPAEARGPDLSKAAENLVARHGDPTAALLVLLGENFKEREKVRELSGRLPREGALVLEGDDAKHWSTYRQLGAPGDIRKALEAGKQHEAEAGNFRRAEVVRSAAEVTGFKASVLATLARDLEIEIEETEEGGKAVREAVVKGEGGERVSLLKYAESRWPDFLSSLKMEAAPRVGTPTVPRPRTVPAGTGQQARRRPISTF